MKLIIALLFSLGAVFGTVAHDTPMAIFTVSEQAGGLALSVEVDRSGYARVNGDAEETPATENFEAYLNKKSAWVVNGEHAPVKVERITTEGHHFTAHCRLNARVSTVDELKVYNRFLLDIKDQTNVVMLQLHNDSRGFRMHQGRQLITVKY